MIWYLSPEGKALMAVALIWSVIWKGFALWKAAHRNERWWFIAFMVVNTVGVLEIVYIYYFSKRGKKETS